MQARERVLTLRARRGSLQSGKLQSLEHEKEALVPVGVDNQTLRSKLSFIAVQKSVFEAAIQRSTERRLF